MNEIPKIQNDEQQLDMLAAQHQIYSEAKILEIVRIILTIPVVAFWLILIAWWDFDLKIYAAYYGVVIAFFNSLGFTSWIDSLQKKGAKMKELFDCKVLELPWYDLKVGPNPDRDTIVKYSSKHYRKNSKKIKLKDWYPVGVQKLQMPLARFVCQRSNLQWDAELRKFYTLVIAVAVGCLIVVVFLLGLWEGFTVEKLLMAIVLPLMPAIFWVIHQYKAHNASISRQQHLKEYVDKLWDDTLDGRISDTQLEIESRNLQNEIYEKRSNDPLIFSWIYKLRRNKQEEQMSKIVEKLLKEVEESDRKSKCS